MKNMEGNMKESGKSKVWKNIEVKIQTATHIRKTSTKNIFLFINILIEGINLKNNPPKINQ